jgi:hypothetical protein
MTQAQQLIQIMRGRRWWTTGDLQATRISTCPWRRLAESGSQHLRKGERIETKIGLDGLKRFRVVK